MTLQEHLEREKSNVDRVFLTPEGLFYKAYERSAYILNTQYAPLKPARVKVEYLGGADVVSVGFPKTSLSKVQVVLQDCSSGEPPVLEALFPIDEDEFRAWKDSVPLKEAVARNPEQEEPDTGIVRSIRNFPLENSTPIDCMMFVASLKKLLAK